MRERILVICMGALLDLCFGDPQWLWHPVRGMGKLTEWTEAGLRRLFRLRADRDADAGKKKAAGALLAAIVPAVSLAAVWGSFWKASSVIRCWL